MKQDNILDKLSTTVSSWLKSNYVNNDVLISFRLRLARNVVNFPFSTTITKEQKIAILQQIEKAVPSINIGKVLYFLKLDDLDAIDKKFLFERHLISKDLTAIEGSGVIFSEDELLSIMVNEEDHLRIQFLYGEYRPYALWEGLSLLDDQINKIFPYAFSEELGYLTCCVTNVGCGFRITLLVHLPAMSLGRQFEYFLRSTKIKKINIRGVFGEGSQPVGSFYQISNQSSFGQSEGEIIDEMSKFLNELAKAERKVRLQILKESRTSIEDRIYRALGVLKYAKQISMDEAMELLSIIRFGIFSEIISDISLDLFNELFLFVQPAHLQKVYKEKFLDSVINVKRAEYLKEKLKPFLS